MNKITGNTMDAQRPVDRLVMPEYGSRVTVREQYVRRSKGHDKGTWKYWKPVPFEANNCIYLGTRILKNGVRDYDYEAGYYFDPYERFTVALVSPGKNLNPIYVPLESIKA